MKEVKFYYLCSEHVHKEHMLMNGDMTLYQKNYFRPLDGMSIYPDMETLNRDFHNWCVRNNKDDAYIGEIVIKQGKHVELVTSYQDYKEKEK